MERLEATEVSPPGLPAVVVPSPAETAETVVAVSAPVQQAERITALDTLRGFALLGILLMNIIGFSMYGAAYDNPTVTGGSDGPNLAVWAILHVLAEGKMRCLFSLVFGASVILLTTRLERTGQSADIYYRRTLWLMLFGIVHAYLLWLGDILYPYAICALALYPFRRMSTRGLWITGGLFVLLAAGAYVGQGFETRDKIAKGRAAIAAEQSGKKLTDEQKKERSSYEEWQRFAQPSREQLENDLKDWRGNFLSVVKARAKFVGMFHSMPYYGPMNWDIWSMMLIGMALFRTGVLSAQRPAVVYWKMMAVGYGIGIPVNTYTAWLIVKSNFDPVTQSMLGATYDVGRLTVALGHLALIMLMCRSASWSWLTMRLGAVGQMAFSNYIMHSVICAFLFTGYGLALYGRFQRYQVYYVVLAIWIFQLIISPIWLRHFRFGPMEWLWRSLTYWKKQPMRLAASPSS